MPYIGNTTSDFSIDTGNITNRAVTATKLSPSSVGSNGQVLSVDGSGNLQWGNDANAPEGTAVLSTGESGTTKFLRIDGDGTCSWQVPPTQISFSNDANNRIVTGTGSGLNGEANLTFNGSGDLTLKGNDGISANLYLIADRGDDDGDGWRVGSNQDDNDLTIANNTSGSYVDKITLLKTGEATFAGSLIISENNALHFKGTYADDLDSILRESSGNALLINSRNDAILNIDANGDSTDAHFAVAHGAATSGSTELFRVQENGNVGIGTSGPTETLHVYQNAVDNVNVLLEQAYVNSGNLIQFKQITTGSVTRTAYIGHGGDATGQLMIQNSGNIYLQTGGSNTALTIDATQKVGIGTTSPTGIHNLAKVLELSGGDGGDLIIGNNVSTNIGAGAHIGAIAFKNIDNSTGTSPHYAGIRCEAADTSGNMDLRFYTGIADLEADTPQLYINSTGSVGIGTTSPSTKLSLEGADGSASNGILIGAKNAGGIRGVIEVHTAASTVGFNLSRTSGGSDTDVVRLEMDGDSHGLIQVRNSSNAQRVRLDNHGIKFGTDTAELNALDDYEEGGFSPGWFDDGGNFVSSYNVQYGQYTKIGNVVYFCFGLRIGGFSRTPNASQKCRVGNLPFNSRTVGDDEEVGFTLYARLWGSGTPPKHACVRQATDSNHVDFLMEESQTGNDDLLTGSDFDTSSSCRVIVNGFYYTS